MTIEQYEKHLDRNVERVAQKLRNGTYNPQPVKRVMIPKPGSKDKRPLGIPTVEDKMVQMATYNVIAPIFEKDFSENSFGFRPNRGCKDALRGVEKALKDGYLFVVDADIKGYFDNIPHGRLINKIKRKIADRR
ncbi:MAG: group II intron reverse transcriptase/maturase, partial [Clostridia bacterium]|nr:group II intron reverse transcriptase/maturase [Clostridia bacterium]